MSYLIIEDGRGAIEEVNVNHVVSSKSLANVVDLVGDRRDRIACDNIEVGSLRRADERYDVRPRKLVSPFGAVDVCPCRSRSRSRRTGRTRVPFVTFVPFVSF